MKLIIIIILNTFLCYKLMAGTLKCSARGASVLHIPGAFISNSDQLTSFKQINNDILTNNPNKFDLTSQNAELVPIVSQGLIQDKISYIMNSYGEAYGTKAEEVAWLTFGIAEYQLGMAGDIETVTTATANLSKVKAAKEIGLKANIKLVTSSKARETFIAMSNLSSQGVSLVTQDGSKTILKLLTEEDGKDALTQTGKYLGMANVFTLNPVGIKNTLNYFSIALLEKNFSKWIDQQRGTILATYWETSKNVDNVARTILDKFNQNKKVIISAHGEGNQLANRAIAQIRDTGTEDQKIKLNKYLSVLATSPTSDIYVPTKYHYMKNDLDVRYFGGSTTQANYVLLRENLIDFKSSNSFFSMIGVSSDASSFLNYYISPIVKARFLSDSKYISMRDHYINNLKYAAEDLEDNCSEPNIEITSPDATLGADGKYKVSGYTHPGRTVDVHIRDLNDKDNSTVFEITYSEFKYNKDVYPYNIYTTNKILGNSFSLPVPYEDIDFQFTVIATNTQTGKVSMVKAIFDVVANQKASLTFSDYLCYVDTLPNGDLRQTGAALMRFVPHDIDSYYGFSITYWYPNPNTGSYEESPSNMEDYYYYSLAALENFYKINKGVERDVIDHPEINIGNVQLEIPIKVRSARIIFNDVPTHPYEEYANPCEPGVIIKRFN